LIKKKKKKKNKKKNNDNRINDFAVKFLSSHCSQCFLFDSYQVHARHALAAAQLAAAAPVFISICRLSLSVSHSLSATPPPLPSTPSLSHPHTLAHPIDSLRSPLVFVSNISASDMKYDPGMAGASDTTK